MAGGDIALIRGTLALLERVEVRVLPAAIDGALTARINARQPDIARRAPVSSGAEMRRGTQR
jgi:hypothetical protein